MLALLQKLKATESKQALTPTREPVVPNEAPIPISPIAPYNELTPGEESGDEWLGPLERTSKVDTSSIQFYDTKIHKVPLSHLVWVRCAYKERHYYPARLCDNTEYLTVACAECWPLPADEVVVEYLGVPKAHSKYQLSIVKASDMKPYSYAVGEKQLFSELKFDTCPEWNQSTMAQMYNRCIKRRFGKQAEHVYQSIKSTADAFMRLAREASEATPKKTVEPSAMRPRDMNSPSCHSSPGEISSRACDADKSHQEQELQDAEDEDGDGDGDSVDDESRRPSSVSVSQSHSAKKRAKVQDKVEYLRPGDWLRIQHAVFKNVSYTTRITSIDATPGHVAPIKLEVDYPITPNDFILKLASNSDGSPCLDSSRAVHLMLRDFRLIPGKISPRALKLTYKESTSTGSSSSSFSSPSASASTSASASASASAPSTCSSSSVSAASSDLSLASSGGEILSQSATKSKKSKIPSDLSTSVPSKKKK